MIRQLSTDLHAAAKYWEKDSACLRDLGSSPAEILQEFVRLDEATERVVDKALRRFARGGRWPKLTGAEAYFVYRRLRGACSMCDLLAHWESFRRGYPIELKWEPMDREQVLLWLLFHCWEDHGYGSISETLAECIPLHTKPPRSDDNAN